MPSRRVERAAEAIRGVVSMAILAELNDPRIRDVTVTYVEVSPDLRHAKVHVSVMGDETRQKLSLRGLQNAAGFLQAKIAERIEIRYTPKLSFLLDQGVKRSIAVAQILQQVLPSAKGVDCDPERSDCHPERSDCDPERSDCHPERSEGSSATSEEILRSAQDDGPQDDGPQDDRDKSSDVVCPPPHNEPSP
jgi:ribosome-binding factor A